MVCTNHYIRKTNKNRYSDKQHWSKKRVKVLESGSHITTNVTKIKQRVVKPIKGTTRNCYLELRIRKCCISILLI